MRLVKTQKISSNFAKIVENLLKICVFVRLWVKIHVSQVFLDPIQNCISPMSAHLEAAYLEAFLYLRSYCLIYLLCKMYVCLHAELAERAWNAFELMKWRQQQGLSVVHCSHIFPPQQPNMWKKLT